MKKYGLLLLPALFAVLSAAGQSAVDTVPRGGAWARMEVENGDTTFVMSLWPVKIATRRKFKDRDEQKQYYRYVRAARKVYPFALKAIELYEDIQEETADMNKRQRRRYVRHEHKELKEDFKDQMKNLSKTEGKVLIKMIERQLDKPFYTIIKETRGGATATYWQTVGKFWGYDLKDGYQLGTEPLLDDALLDYDFGDAVYRY
ncbi:MAG: DUF4294 domain-containing protein [Saprospiraceae bacterium]|nr:DUF4294 domain-containing protein [Saprospiraceae bacterium]MCB0576361.1 DUF4294 domain-containing protein [Saprospiraceae bacterium]MCB9306828.1 DUF4294 domain-containing protein [Lewinellaceae bacterium]MCB9356396.1 DUF4294 domain-containing protein [Lewinellaceae bacterium]